MNLRIISWNISLRSNSEKIGNFLLENISENTVINLQEVTRPAFLKLDEILKATHSFYSISLREPGKNEGRNRTLGLATFVFNATELTCTLLERSVFPERTLISKIKFDKEEIHILNFHSITGADYKKAKSSNFATIADYIEENNSTLDFFTCDANEPNIDSIVDDEVKFYDNRDKGKNASLILGSSKNHDLNDSYKLILQRDDKIINQIPLTTSYVTGKTKRRYDFIYCSDKWKPVAVEYLYEKSINASSDHSIVIGDFQKNEPSPKP